MNTHEEFERWILEEEALSPEETQRLSRHIAECESCRTLQENLNQNLAFIKNSSMIKPAAGFVARWQQQLALRTKEKQESERIRLILGVLGLMSVLSISSCLVIFSPGNLVNTGLRLSNLLKLVAINIHQLKTMLSVLKIPLLIFSAGSVILMIVYVLVGALSAVTIKRIRKGA